MQELINKLISEAGLNPEQAQKAMQTTINFVRSKIPPAYAANFESLLSGMKFEAKEASYKDKAADFAEATKDKLEDLAESAREKLSDAADKAEDLARDAVEKLKDMFGGDKKKD